MHEFSRIVQAALRGFFQDVYDRVVVRLSAPVCTALDALLVVDSEETQSLFDRLKAEPAAPGVKNCSGKSLNCTPYGCWRCQQRPSRTFPSKSCSSSSAGRTMRMPWDARAF